MPGLSATTSKLDSPSSPFPKLPLGTLSIGGPTTRSKEGKAILVIPGTDTKRNPVGAFKQGLDGEMPTKAYRLTASRCAKCGNVTLQAPDSTQVPFLE